MPLVTVEWIQGRSREQKEQLTEAITKACIDIAKVSKDHVWIIYKDVPRENWAMAGELLDKK